MHISKSGDRDVAYTHTHIHIIYGSMRYLPVRFLLQCASRACEPRVAADPTLMDKTTISLFCVV